MIQSLKYLLLPFMGLLVISCSSTQNLPVKSVFQFDHNEQTYQIISISSPDGEGRNFLTKMEGDLTTLKYLDMDQDGILEVIQFGGLGLTEANLIYAAGIQKAMEAGKFRNREGSRKFEFAENDTLFTIETIGHYVDHIYNKFTIVDLRNNSKTTFLDHDSDGQLDAAEAEKANLQRAQNVYSRILQRGIDQAQIYRSDKKYMVKFKAV
ncbi:MAG TPA: hypothetical protein DD671_16280 [Balneolaceae bacterium]|nr:hypothetical protein [Balneolaceae bacterium]